MTSGVTRMMAVPEWSETYKLATNINVPINYIMIITSV